MRLCQGFVGPRWYADFCFKYDEGLWYSFLEKTWLGYDFFDHGAESPVLQRVP